MLIILIEEKNWDSYIEPICETLGFGKHLEILTLKINKGAGIPVSSVRFDATFGNSWKFGILFITQYTGFVLKG